jgi:hypothetical protein
LEYTLNTMNIISQNTVTTAQGLQDGLSRVLDQITGPMHRFVYDAWPTAGTSAGVPTVYMVVGALIFVAGYLTLRRA